MRRFLRQFFSYRRGLAQHHKCQQLFGVLYIAVPGTFVISTALPNPLLYPFGHFGYVYLPEYFI